MASTRSISRATIRAPSGFAGAHSRLFANNSIEQTAGPAARLARSDVAERLATLAINPMTSTPDELERYIPAKIAKSARVVKDAGITPE
jgi:hypothetical protein